MQLLHASIIRFSLSTDWQLRMAPPSFWNSLRQSCKTKYEPIDFRICSLFVILSIFSHCWKRMKLAVVVQWSVLVPGWWQICGSSFCRALFSILFDQQIFSVLQRPSSCLLSLTDHPVLRSEGYLSIWLVWLINLLKSAAECSFFRTVRLSSELTAAFGIYLQHTNVIDWAYMSKSILSFAI